MIIKYLVGSSSRTLNLILFLNFNSLLWFKTCVFFFLSRYSHILLKNKTSYIQGLQLFFPTSTLLENQTFMKFNLNCNEFRTQTNNCISFLKCRIDIDPAGKLCRMETVQPSRFYSWLRKLNKIEWKSRK
jgi:hypothetical protein